MTIRWQDEDTWGNWDKTCNWTPSTSSVWVCILPSGHSGPHVANMAMDDDPRLARYESSPNVNEWAYPRVCDECGNAHPGFRHATRNDPVHIAESDAGFWGPAPNPHFPMGEPGVLLVNQFVPTFVDDPFPTPPKFKTREEVEAWLEANPP